MKVIIDRAKWRCGYEGDTQRGLGDTGLLNADGFMCCLGFASKKCGVPRKLLREAGYPECLAGSIEQHRSFQPMLDAGLLSVSEDSHNVVNGEFSYEAADINDDDSITDKQREEKLIACFKKYEHELTFVGEYTAP